jgi:type I restriction enzyme M protein
LFVERTKQLLKDGGVAGIILPSSILSNEGIYTKAREIILRYFEIIAITELGSNTFMATGTNTVVLFLRRRNNYDCQNYAASLENSLNTYQDNTINGVEKPITKYVNHVWENVGFEDYVTLLKKTPNNVITNHEIYKEYRKKLKAKTEKDFWNALIEIEKEKLLYFILAYPQKNVVLIKTGEKEAEKRFLGYEFSNRRGNEGIHPIQRDKTIDECTKLFDEEKFDNPEKASTYIYKAFSNDYDFSVHESLENNISYTHLVDMLTFDRAGFAKVISTAVKKKVKIESKWDIVKLSDVAHIDWGNTDLTKTIYKENGQYDVYSASGLDGKTDFYEQEGNAIILSAIGARCGKCFFTKEKWTAIKNTIIIKNKENILLKYLFQYVNNENYWEKSGTAQPFITLSTANEQKIPLPPLDIQHKIVSEIDFLEKKEVNAKEKINLLTNQIYKIINDYQINFVLLSDIAEIRKGTSITKEKTIEGDIPVIAGGKEPAYFHNVANRNGNVITVTASGAYSGFVNFFKIPIFASDCNTIQSKNEKIIFTKLIYLYLQSIQEKIYTLQRGQAQPHVYADDLAKIEIPLPPLSEQQRIVAEIEKIEAQITELEQELSSVPQEKEAVLKKYL